ncbi:MAG: glycosyltransferase family 2 protein [Xanthomonadaceae bacterium]|nr:glycosyltransferase family 2 protein [Xanthomonadaceae bacterium]
MPSDPIDLELSVVIPALDESQSIGALLDEVLAALRGRQRFEVIVVDDGSTDPMPEVLAGRLADTPELRVLRHSIRAGQSTALRTGVKAARAPWIATLDGDGQNDPADIPALLAARDGADGEVKLLNGWRMLRRDSVTKRLASRIANSIRRRLLRDRTPDSACGIKLFERAAFLDLPYFDHMHRFLPALFQRAGWRSLSIPVNHRPRAAGRSKYGNWQRAWVGISDLWGVSWLIRRSRRVRFEEVERS